MAVEVEREEVGLGGVVVVVVVVEATWEGLLKGVVKKGWCSTASMEGLWEGSREHSFWIKSRA